MGFGDKKGLKFIEKSLPYMKVEHIYNILGICENKQGKYNQEIKDMCNRELDKRDKK